MPSVCMKLLSNNYLKVSVLVEILGNQSPLNRVMVCHRNAIKSIFLHDAEKCLRIEQRTRGIPCVVVEVVFHNQTEHRCYKNVSRNSRLVRNGGCHPFCEAQ